MVLSFLLLLALCGQIVASVEIKKHVQNSVYPYDLDPPSYNIESWVQQLHLQQCALVEVGDKYYAIFVESRPRRYDHEKGIKEYFLGLCDDDTLNKWSFCAANLQRKRAEDCNFYTRNMYNTRVHRRLCDLTLLAMNAPQCDCSSDLSDSKLYKVQGFPTCFKPPLPTSLCGDNNVCGLAGCSPRTINKRVHSIKCDRKCNENQPFCEPCDKKSSQPRQIKSFWTDWSNPYCTDTSCISQFDEAVCINRETGRGDIDCLGPGTSCCTPELQNCKCHVYEEGGATKVFRTFSIPQPEMAEYMSEEDFINSIPLRYLKEEFHKYPGYSSRTVRSNFGRAFKQTLANIYDSFPLKFGNTHRKRKTLKRFKTAILKPYNTIKDKSEGRKHQEPQGVSTKEITTTLTTKPSTTSSEGVVTYSPWTSSSSSSTTHSVTSALIDNGITKATEESTTTVRTEQLSESTTTVRTEQLPESTTTVRTEQLPTDHEVNPEPVDTFSTQHSLEPGECEPCKRHLTMTKPRINTNGIHQRQRIHHPNQHPGDPRIRRKGRAYEFRVLPRRSNSKLRFKLRPIYTRPHSQYQRYEKPYKRSRRRKYLYVDGDKGECENKNSFLLANDAPDVLLYGADDDERTLKKKLSFDLIFDDTKVPNGEDSPKCRSSPGKSSYKIPVKRQYEILEKIAYERVTPKFAVFLDRGEINTPTEALVGAKESDPHIEQHLYARVYPVPEATEQIAQFGYLSETTNPVLKTTYIRKQALHSEMEDDDFITDENGMFLQDNTDIVIKVIEPTPLPPQAIVTKKKAALYSNFHAKRADDADKSFDLDSSPTGSYLGGTTSTQAVADTDYDRFGDLPENGHKIREDDKEDALEFEDKFDRLNDEENDIFQLNCPSKSVLKPSPVDHKRSENVNADILEDEDEHSRKVINPGNSETPDRQPDVIEDEDLIHPAPGIHGGSSTESVHESDDFFDEEEEQEIQSQQDSIRKRFGLVSSEEIADDDDITYADDDEDVALEYDEADKEERDASTTELVCVPCESKSVNAKMETAHKEGLTKNETSTQAKNETATKAKSAYERTIYHGDSIYTLTILSFIYFLL